MAAAPHDPLSSYAFINFPVELPPPSPQSASSSTTMSSVQQSPHGLIVSGPSSSASSPSFYTHLLPGTHNLADLIPEEGIAARRDRDRRDKKSHAKRQPQGHVPRPRNAFILFRSDFVAQKIIAAEVENNHRNISRIAGVVWKRMDDAQRAPWTRAAAHEKTQHKAQYPNYRYNPLASAEGAAPAATRRKGKRKGGQSQSQPSSPHKVESFDGGSPYAPEERNLRMPRRSFSAPPQVIALEEVTILQPSLLPLPRGYFSSDYVVPASASDVPMPYAPLEPIEELGRHEDVTAGLHQYFFKCAVCSFCAAEGTREQEQERPLVPPVTT